MTIQIRLLPDFRPGSPTVFGDTLITWNPEGFAVAGGTTELHEGLARWAAKFPKKYEVIRDGSPLPAAQPAPSAIILPPPVVVVPQDDTTAADTIAKKTHEQRFADAVEAIGRNKQRAAARTRNVLDVLKVSGAGSSYQELVGVLRDTFANAGAAARKAIVEAVEAEAGIGAAQ